MKHTSGPWASNDFQIFSGEKVIANMTYGARSSNNEADSRLIAAAPELLKQLTYLRDCIESGIEPAMGDVNRVITRANGGES